MCQGFLQQMLMMPFGFPLSPLILLQYQSTVSIYAEAFHFKYYPLPIFFPGTSSVPWNFPSVPVKSSQEVKKCSAPRGQNPGIFVPHWHSLRNVLCASSDVICAPVNHPNSHSLIFLYWRSFFFFYLFPTSPLILLGLLLK